MSTASFEVVERRSPPREVSRITVDQYLGMFESGLIDEDERVELLNGVIVRKAAQTPPHVVGRELCRDELDRRLRPGFWIRDGGPVRIAPWDMPEPDLIMLRGNLREYAARYPVPADVPLCVEVADSSLARDRGVKRDPYARGGVPVYWIVNLVDRRVEVFADPRDGAYATAVVVEEGGSVELTVDGAVWGRIEVAAVLP